MTVLWNGLTLHLYHVFFSLDLKPEEFKTMPGRRRKKKSELSQWPPLTFVSSPLYQPAPVLEQDMAVTNPVTAKTVPIDDLNEAVWVSSAS